MYRMRRWLRGGPAGRSPSPEPRASLSRLPSAPLRHVPLEPDPVLDTLRARSARTEPDPGPHLLGQRRARARRQRRPEVSRLNGGRIGSRAKAGAEAGARAEAGRRAECVIEAGSRAAAGPKPCGHGTPAPAPARRGARSRCPGRGGSGPEAEPEARVARRRSRLGRRGRMQSERPRSTAGAGSGARGGCEASARGAPKPVRGPTSDPVVTARRGETAGLRAGPVPTADPKGRLAPEPESGCRARRPRRSRPRAG